MRSLLLSSNMAAALRPICLRQAVRVCRGGRSVAALAIYNGTLWNEKSTINALQARHMFHQSHDQGQSTRYPLLTPTFLAAFSFGFTKKEPTDEENQKKKEEEEEKEKQKTNKNDEVILVIKQAKLAEMKQNFPEVEMLYHRAIGLLNIYKQNKNWDAEAILEARIYIYDSLANLAMSQGQYVKAEKLYKEVMKGLLQEGYPKDDNAIVEISLKLAMIYAMAERREEAEGGYKFCIESMEKKVEKANEEKNPVDDDTLALLGLAVDAYSKYLIVHKRLPEALLSLQRALSIARSVFGDNHEQVAVLLNDLATIEVMMKDMGSARRHVAEAVKIASHTSSPDLAAFLCNLGAIHLQSGELKEAKGCCEKALRLAMVDDDQNIKKQAKFCLEKVKEKQKKT